jgi:multidrug efflux pump subunit AcrA (membrane-fusion protein)
MSYRAETVFREQARRSLEGAELEGSPLRLASGWIHWTYWLLVAVGLMGLVFAALADIGEHAHGPAVVRLRGRTPVTAVEPGVVAELTVEPGQRVQAGEVLVRLHDDAERAALLRLEQELRAKQVELLRDPYHPAHREVIARLRAERVLALARVTQRVVRAPHDGVMSDARIAPGQRVEAGQVLLTLAGAEARREVLALLPGHYRPLLQPGMTMHLELAGYHGYAQLLTIDTIGDEVVGPGVVQRLLGDDLAETFAVQGPVVLVRASLPAAELVAGPRRYPYFDGMAGTAQVKVRTQSLMTTLVPGLHRLREAAGTEEPR